MSFIFRERVFGLSCRQLAACLDSIGWRAAADILKRLERDGLLTCVKRGRYFPGTVSKASMWMFNHEGVE